VYLVALYKIESFIQKNQIVALDKDPMDSFQKQIQQIIHKCNRVIGRHQHKYLLQIKPAAPKLYAMIKTHKDNNPIIPVMNSIEAPSYKFARFIGRKLRELMELPYTYSTKNSKQVAQ
jgi:hypothetical protein